MVRDGKALEAFVAQIEREAALPGAKITSNVKEYSENGRQLAEFDIIVEGTFGTTEMRWLIECRDRPLGGAAPNSWVEQLIGRKQGHVKFDRVTAVSTTGFAEGCKELAASHRIELRTVDRVDPMDFARWIEPFDLNYIRRFANLVNVAIEPDWGDQSEQDERLAPLLALGGNALRFWSEKNQEISTPGDAFLSILNGSSLWSGLAAGEKKAVSILAQYQDNDRFELELEDRRLPLRSIKFDGEIWTEHASIPIRAAERYVKNSTDEIIAERVQWHLPMADKNAVLEIVKIGYEGPGHIQLRFID